MDWRTAFSDWSRLSWEAAVARAAGAEAHDLAGPYLAAWRYDNRMPEARSLERHFVASRALGPPDLVDPQADRDLDDREAEAVERVVTATRDILAGRGVTALTLYRGQRAGASWAVGDVVRVSGRGLTPWTPDASIAHGYAAKHRPGAVLTAEVDVTAVAFAYDPASDGEVVVIGEVVASVSRLVS